jgi:NCAIR mutase (PurE)-related protein
MTGACRLPVTAKIRLGWDGESRNVVEVCRALEDAGAAAVAIHARTRAEKFEGHAHWEMIAEARKAVGIPVIGNGDVKTEDDALRMLRETGCDGVMLGRAAFGDPWVFRRVRALAERGERVAPPSADERLEAGLRHLVLMTASVGAEQAAREMRKHVAWYVKGLPHSARVREQVNRTRTVAEMASCSTPIATSSRDSVPRRSTSRPRPARDARSRMQPAELKTLLRRVRTGDVGLAEASKRIQNGSVERLQFATLDHERSLRTGFPEVVFGPGKTPQQLVAIVGRLFRRSGVVLATRVDEAGREAVRRAFPRAEIHDRSGAIVLRRRAPRGRGQVLVVCAGTADLPVAEEALVTARALGSRARLIADVGVAGLHRLLSHTRELRGARALVVVAGLEVRCRASSAASSIGPSSRCRRASATARTSAGWRRCSRCSTRARRDHGGEREQRLRRRVRRAPDQRGRTGVSMRIAYFDCFSGISGDMCLGALVSAGWPAATLQSLPARLALEGVDVAVSDVRRGPFAARRVEVSIPGAPAAPPSPSHRRDARAREHRRRRARAGAARVPAAGRGRGRGARQHAREGALPRGRRGRRARRHRRHDRGAGHARRRAGVRLAAPARPRHGELGARSDSGARAGDGAAAARRAGRDPALEAELVTPTGAALLAELVERWEPPPPFRIEAIGTGAGGRDLASSRTCCACSSAPPTRRPRRRRTRARA